MVILKYQKKNTYINRNVLNFSLTKFKICVENLQILKLEM